MLSSLPISQAPEPYLYEVVAHGVRLSPTCERGHAMVMELLQRIGVFDGAHSRQGSISPLENNGPSTPVSNPKTAEEQAAHQAPPPTLSPTASTLAEPSAKVSSGIERMLLSQMVDLHLRNMKRSKRGERSATRERRYILDLLAKVVGDKPVDEITVEDATAFADFLTVWPVYQHNHPDFKHMSALSIAAKAKANKMRPIHSATQAKHIKAIKAFFHWCVESKAVLVDPFRFIELSRYRDLIQRKKDVFSVPDLEALFNADRQRTHTEPHKFWAPLIAFYTGMRINEICQLYLDDIKSETVKDETGKKHTVSYFDVTPFRDGQSVKSAYSRRRIPIHSKLIELGFENYLADVRQSGAIHLLPGLTWGTDGPGRVITQWFNGPHLRKQCGITSHSKSLHCFRHTITTLADRCWVPTSIMRTINGHSDGKDIDKAAYVARGSLLECKKGLEKIEFPELPWVTYSSGRFDLYLSHAASHQKHRERLLSDGKPAPVRKGRPPRLGPSLAVVGSR